MWVVGDIVYATPVITIGYWVSYVNMPLISTTR